MFTFTKCPVVWLRLCSRNVAGSIAGEVTGCSNVPNDSSGTMAMDLTVPATFLGI
jgi:hypothetical protein